MDPSKPDPSGHAAPRRKPGKSKSPAQAVRKVPRNATPPVPVKSTASTRARAAAPANPKQLEFLKAIGLIPPRDCTLLQATQLIVRAQNARFFAWKVARQEWGVDLDGRALLPVIQGLLARPAEADRIVTLMDAYLQELLGAGEEPSDPEGRSASETAAPELARDDLYAKVRSALLHAHPKLEKKPAPAARPSVLQEQETLKRIQDEMEPRFYVGRDTLRDRMPSRRVAAAVLAGAFFAVGLFLALRKGQADPSTAEPSGAAAQEAVEAPSRPVLQPGRVYRTPIPLPLDDTADSAFERIPARGLFKVLGQQTAGGDRRYEVFVYDASKRELGSGWLQADHLPEDGLSEVHADAIAAGEHPAVASEPQALPQPQPLIPPEPQPAESSALAAYKLPDGRSLETVVTEFRALAAETGWTVWSGAPVVETTEGQETQLALTIAWKINPHANWQRRSCRWRLDPASGALEPLNPDAQSMPTLKDEILRSRGGF